MAERGVTEMKCEYCESEIRIVPDNGVCPHCGAALQMEKQKLQFPESVIGVYYTAWQRCEIGPNHIRIVRKVFEKSDYRISLDDIRAVSFVPGTGFHSGFLCVRTKSNMEKPMPMSTGQAQEDETTFVYATPNNMKKMYQVFVFLQEAIKTNQST